MINIDVINECTSRKLPFPEIIKHLREIGIERYYTDLLRLEKTYYTRNGESYVERMLVDNLLKLADSFNETRVIEALHSIQKGDTDYHTFLKNIISAGTISYSVYIDGKQAIYVGRNGETYIQKFPF